jgi:hypothetical protein
MNWYVRKSDDVVFGPVTLGQLQAWASEGRIVPSDLISSDQETWEAAHGNADLQMDWFVQISEDETYGPVHILAFIDLMQNGSVAAQAMVRNKGTEAEIVLSEALLSAVLDRATALEERIHTLNGQIAEQQDAARRLEGQHERALTEWRHQAEEALSQSPR